MPKKKTSWQREGVAWQPSPDDPKIVSLRFPGWVFWPDAPEDEKLIIRVRLLGPEERDALEAFMLPGDLMGFCGELISLSLVDRGGQRVFSSEKDKADINSSASTPICALAHALLEVNGLLPPLDQTIAREKDARGIDFIDFIVDGLVEATHTHYPAWSQEKLGEFRRYARLVNPVISFLLSYKKKYHPESEERDHILPVLPFVPERERRDALDRLFAKHPKPIHYKRWEVLSWYVMRGLAGDAKAHGVPVEEELKNRRLDSLKAALVTARRKTGIFATKEEFVQKLKRAYRKEAETDLRIPKRTDAFSYLETERPKVTKNKPEEQEEVEDSDLVEKEELTATHRELHPMELVGQLDLWKRFERLPRKDKEMIRVLFEKGEDRRATAKALNITVGCLNQRLSRMKRKPL